MDVTSKDFTAPNGAKMTFWFRPETNDENTIIATFQEDYYGVLKEKYLNKDVVLDLGASIGTVSLLFNAVNPKMKIIAVEPLPENCELFKKNMRANNVNPRTIRLYEKALWTTATAKLPIYYGDDTETGRVHKYVGMPKLEKGSDKGRKVHVAKTVSLRKILKRIPTCRFVKMDVEGVEELVLRRTPKKILKGLITICGEYHAGPGKELVKIIKGTHRDIAPKHKVKENDQYFRCRSLYARK